MLKGKVDVQVMLDTSHLQPVQLKTLLTAGLSRCDAILNLQINKVWDSKRLRGWSCVVFLLIKYLDNEN